MLIKGGHVGLGFKGVSFGQDKDRGFREILRAGLYVMANIVAKDALRFDIRSGYDFDRVATTTSKEASRHFLTQEAVLAWQAQSFSGNVKASIAFNPESFFDTKSMRAGASTSVRARIVSFEDLEVGASAQVSGEYDPFLEVLGLKPFNATGTLMMDLSWVAVRDHSN
jgi:hypothetical protein